MQEPHRLIDMTADIVAAFVSNNPVRAAELPDLIKTIHASLNDVVEPKPVEAQAPTLTPAVPVKKSVTDDFIVCLEDGKKFKSLRRHLATAFGMTPDDYRAKWGLPRDYPMVAPGYASKRSELAKATGLGSARRKAAPANDAMPAAEPEAVIAAPPPVVEEAPVKRRGRPKKAA